MSIYPVTQSRPPAPYPVIYQILATLGGGFALFLVFCLVLLIGSGTFYAGKIYPGVSIAGMDMSGRTETEAAALLAGRLTYPQTGQIIFQYQDALWAVHPEQLGLYLDAATNAGAAYSLGRSGNLFSRLIDRFDAWHSGRVVAVEMTFDQREAFSFLTQIADQIDRPVVEASLTVSGLEVAAVPGQVGLQVDTAATLERLDTQLRTLTDGIVPIEVVETAPKIIDASPVAEVARRMLSAPLTLTLPDWKEGDPGPWSVTPEQLATMLKVTREPAEAGGNFQVALDGQSLYSYLTSLAGAVDRYPQNARFIFNDETRQLELIQPAVIGRNLDVYSTIRTINEKIAAGEHNVLLTMTLTQPQVSDTATGEQLGITQQVVAYTSYFRGSSAERLQNIQAAAANFHGLLVPPGAEFSMASVMGDVSLDTGYAEAWIIFGGKTIKGVGGGVCQVSTTLFRAAFFGGYPIVERYPHAYRVGYYEQTSNGWDENLAGLDATVFVPMVDFKFINDTSYWLLMETYFHPNSRSLTWKFYSTSDGRTVEWDTSGPQNIVDPPDPTYEENPELAQGEIIQVDWAAEGADITVNRTVNRNGSVLFTDAFVTHYLPWADAYQYGPGTNLPRKARQPGINP